MCDYTLTTRPKNMYYKEKLERDMSYMKSENKQSTWALFWAIIIGFLVAGLIIMYVIVPFWMCPAVVSNIMAPGNLSYSQLCSAYP